MELEELFNGFEWRITLEEADLPDGRKKKAALVHRCDTVHLLAFNGEGNILLLREFRAFYGTYIWMLPSGRVDKEKDSTIAAARELQEETGFRAEELSFYCSCRQSETLRSVNHIFIARNLHRDPLPQDTDEFIEVHTMSIEQAIENVLSSAVIHTPSAYALLRYVREHT